MQTQRPSDPAISRRLPATSRLALSPSPDGGRLERRGRWWVFGSFLLCPCHLPLTLTALAAVLGGTTVGAALSRYPWVAGAIITLTWLAGTAYGFRLLHRAQRGAACPVPTARRTGTPPG